MELPTVLTVDYILSRSLQARFPVGSRVISTCGHTVSKGTVIPAHHENTVHVKWDHSSTQATFNIDTINKITLFVMCQFCERNLSKVGEWFVDRDDQRTCDGNREHKPLERD